MENNDRIVYSIDVEDIQTVAEEELGRLLTEDELKTIENNLGDYVAWYDAIHAAILNEILIPPKQQR